MISMTGYACREKTEQDFAVSVEIKGCNSRYLELNINLPPWLLMMETKIREFITSRCNRGKVDVFIKIRDNDTPITLTVNKQAAIAWYEQIASLAADLGLDEKPNLDMLLKTDGIFQIEKNRDTDNYWQEIEPLFYEAVGAFCIEREREGKNTKDDIIKNLEIIEISLKAVESFVPVIENNIKDNVKSRFAEILGSNADENRVMSEIAVLLLKYTISEEISRLKSHLTEFRSETEKNPKPGKKLDFLSQEINREINTIGSKSAIVEVSNEVVKMKEALENIREQLRNVE